MVHYSMKKAQSSPDIPNLIILQIQFKDNGQFPERPMPHFGQIIIFQIQILQRGQHGQTVARHHRNPIRIQIQNANGQQPAEAVALQIVSQFVFAQIELEQCIHGWPGSRRYLIDAIVAQHQHIQRQRNGEYLVELVMLDVYGSQTD